MNKHKQRKLRHHRIRAKISGTTAKPRLSIFRSLNHIYAQLIDDENGKTLVAASSKEIKGKVNKKDQATTVGKLVAQKALDAGIGQATFDRGGFRYHGRVKSLADAARAAGLKF